MPNADLNHSVLQKSIWSDNIMSRTHNILFFYVNRVNVKLIYRQYSTPFFRQSFTDRSLTKLAWSRELFRNWYKSWEFPSASNWIILAVYRDPSENSIYFKTERQHKRLILDTQPDWLHIILILLAVTQLLINPVLNIYFE